MLRPASSGNAKRGRAKLAGGALAEAAMQFEASHECSDRSPGSVMSMFANALCVVIESDDSNAIDAATWVHLAHEDEQAGVCGIWIAPVIARSTSLARELISDAIAVWEEQHPTYSGTEVNCLVVKRGGNNEADELFTSLGFDTIFSPPFMRKGLGKNPLPSFPTPPSTYFCLAGWHGT